MEISALEYLPHGKSAYCVARHIQLSEMVQSASGKELRLFVVGDADAAKLKRSIPGARFLGQKKAAIQLSRYFSRLKNGQIGVLKGDYVSERQIGRSAGALLKKLVAADLRAVAVLIVEQKLFGTMLRNAGKNSADVARLPAEADGDSPYAKALRVLQPINVPDFLSKAYIGNSASVNLVRQLVWLAGEHDFPVLIQGESGTGKEIIARTIHECSLRRGRGMEFMAVNCGAISSDLMESELFGHVGGSFTGSKGTRPGVWKSAGHGTIFLDEIGELTLRQQAKILRVLEENEIRPVGADRNTKVFARVLSATNRDLYAMVQHGTFREDLYYRLCVFRIPTPPLREHAEDIPALAQWLWSRIAGPKAQRLPSAVVDCLSEYTWPGNVRELKAVVSGLFAWFGNRARTRDDVETVMYLVGQPGSARAMPTPRQSALKRRVESIQLLKRVDETLRGAEVLLDALRSSRRGKASQIELRSGLSERHRELMQYCEQPLLFASPETFDAVHAVCGKLSYSLEVLAFQPASVKPARNKELRSDIDAARLHVIKELEALARQSVRARG